MTKVWLTQSVLSPYRIKLFQGLAETEGIDFRLILLSAKFRTRPEWKRDLSTLPFRVEVPFGIGYLTGPEHEYCINPFLFPKMLRDRPDVIVCGGFSFATLMALCYRMFGLGRYVIWTEATRLTDGRMGHFRQALRRHMLTKASAVIEAGSLAREYILDLVPTLNPSRIYRAYNCVDNPRFQRSSEEGRELLRNLGLPRENILFVGKLNERKGVPELLQAFRDVDAQRKDVGLVLLGSGPLSEEVNSFRRSFGEGRVYAPGFVDNSEAAGFYAGATAFALLSRLDHNPLVLFEALAAGLPVVCSNRAGNAVDFIRPGVNGYIVDPSDRVAVRKSLLEVLSWDMNRRIACRTASREALLRANYSEAIQGFLAAIRHSV